MGLHRDAGEIGDDGVREAGEGRFSGGDETGERVSGPGERAIERRSHARRLILDRHRRRGGSAAPSAPLRPRPRPDDRESPRRRRAPCRRTRRCDGTRRPPDARRRRPTAPICVMSLLNPRKAREASPRSARMRKASVTVRSGIGPPRQRTTGVHGAAAPRISATRRNRAIWRHVRRAAMSAWPRPWPARTRVSNRPASESRALSGSAAPPARLRCGGRKNGRSPATWRRRARAHRRPRGVRARRRGARRRARSGRATNPHGRRATPRWP